MLANKISTPVAPWLKFRRDEVSQVTVPDSGGCHWPLLAKLHGCSRMGGIIAPTANKRLDELQDQWKMAYQSLQLANHVRVIGYSLPVGDAAVRFLLKTALYKAENLKTFDVICLDDGSAEARYREFVVFRKFRFKSANAVDYMTDIQPGSEAHLPHAMTFGTLEHRHSNFFGS